MANTPGPAVDAAGNPTLDPTHNVKERLELTVQRQDDIRELEALHIREIADLRDAYQKELRVAEAARINAIRAVDVAAVQRAAEVQATQAGVLAATVATSAEAMRAQVGAAAAAAQTALAAALVPIQEAIADLRRAQYEGVGQKTQVVESREEIGGRRQSVGLWIAGAATVSAFFIGAAGIAIAALMN